MSVRSLSLLPLMAGLLAARCGEPAARAQEVSSAAQRHEPSAAQAPDPCSVLTIDEIQAVTGAKSIAPKKEAHGSVGTCNFHEGEQLMPVVSIVLAPGMPDVSSSVEMAAWRSKQGTTWGDVKIIIEPVEGLGVPAIRNQVEDVPLVTVEAGVNGMLLDVTSNSLEHSKALASKAIARLR